MKKLVAFLAAIVLMVSVNSCKKYEDGPLLSLRSKTARIVNEWVIDKVMTNGVDVTANYPDDYLLTINDDLTYTMLGNAVTQEGTWAFDEKKESIIFTLTSSGMDYLYTIKRLKNKELTLVQDINSEVYTYYYVQKPD